MRNGIFEIERKFLIAMPDASVLSAAKVSEIEQTYLVSDTEMMSERVRKRASAEKVQYTHTRKTYVSDMRRVELEDEIGEEEYRALLQRADPARIPVHKRRYCLDYEGHTLEIDVYTFWNDRATLEVEIQDEREEIQIPESIRILKEVTDDKRYTNSNLARQVPMDDLTGLI